MSVVRRWCGRREGQREWKGRWIKICFWDPYCLSFHGSYNLLQIHVSRFWKKFNLPELRTNKFDIFHTKCFPLNTRNNVELLGWGCRVKESQANTKNFQLYFFMEKSNLRCVKEEPEKVSPEGVNNFLWATKKSCPYLVQPLMGHWLMEVPHHGTVP